MDVTFGESLGKISALGRAASFDLLGCK